MRNGLRIIVLALAAFGLTILGGGPAQAGGPTSVLLVSPGTERTASLYNNSSSEYQELMTLLDKAPTEEGLAPAQIGDYVNVTWLIHDVQVWRIDRIYLDHEGGPWVTTTTTMEGMSDSVGSEVWRRVDAKPLLVLLTTVRLLGPDQAPDSAVGDTTPGAGLEAAGVENAGSEASLDATASQTGPWWGLGGLVVGVAATVLVARAKRQNAAPGEVRQELVG